MDASRLRVHYPADLPVSERRDEIVAALRDHQVVVIAGETGSGKTTQVPKMVLEALGSEAAGGQASDSIPRIAHTQPRRIAARAVAERLAEELDTPLGEGVGYRVRFSIGVSKRFGIRKPVGYAFNVGQRKPFRVSFCEPVGLCGSGDSKLQNFCSTGGNSGFHGPGGG